MGCMYKKQNYVVEVHIGKDVFHGDYGPEEGCAKRAIDRIMSGNYASLDEIRVWHQGRCIAKHEVIRQEGMISVSQKEWERLQFAAGIDVVSEVAKLSKLAGKPMNMIDGLKKREG